MADGKKGNKGKAVELLTDESLEKVSGGKKIHIIINGKEGQQGAADGQKRCAPHCQPKWLP